MRIQDVTRRGELVLDIFLGSGTTLIAAERTGRRFRGLDIDPAYVDVALERWSAMTGREPRLAEESDAMSKPVGPRQPAGREPLPQGPERQSRRVGPKTAKPTGRLGLRHRHRQDAHGDPGRHRRAR